MIRNAREENARRGGWVRVFPTAETWPAYGSMLEFSSPNNQILHEHLFPESARKHASRNTSTTVNNPKILLNANKEFLLLYFKMQLPKIGTSFKSEFPGQSGKLQVLFVLVEN